MFTRRISEAFGGINLYAGFVVFYKCYGVKKRDLKFLSLLRPDPLIIVFFEYGFSYLKTFLGGGCHDQTGYY